ncbi:hypothetical protein POSPLADRAFT_1155818 [Postia placenta MAD-698-R-SB12]|uniref:Indoleamine 2,3-dioxygenase n=1 Tax=Postia placenta MAD-698-R-SB12 TaxID=670580 RepID=A0A1X6MMV2_9APHY|nr:hypothetical protein POSPLADRAFT_1155818 [Postia placenta MAD-698-R-SB12]OSX57566.1 hypothetical protein POSPLADRAFT_1155818 [Postia placenta MAD-698-R-SB12]
MDFLHNTLPLDHFLALPRPDHGEVAVGTTDTSTLAAHDFDVDTRTGFMPPQPPLTRLPEQWELWETALDDALTSRLRLAEKDDLAEEDVAKSGRWRTRVSELPILSIEELKQSELLLRRAHHVLAWLMHLYIHSTPTAITEIHIPPPITLPLLQVSAQLQLPPVLTYSDDVLYNWAYKSPPSSDRPLAPPALDNLRCLTLFTGTRDEEEFYLASARIEFRGVEALGLMRAIMDEAFLGDATAVRRITAYLHALARVTADLTAILAAVRDGCDPATFYHDIRPWFKGADSDPRRRWVFDGLERDPALKQPLELSGPSAGQSALIHALDVFLGVDHSAPGTRAVPFLTRMQSYMPRHHRAFLRHLGASPRPLRALVQASRDAALVGAYNAAVGALKVFRDEHVRIVALYILGPSRRAGAPGAPAKGTGGTDAFKFVQGVRNQTAGALLRQE